jgi:hypothetical protein
MNRFITLIVATALAWSAQAAETDAVTEAFGCALNPGQTMADFDKATAAWQADMDKIPGGNEYFAATLTPFRANTEGLDFYWLGVSANLNAWSKNTAAYEASPEGRAAGARFAKVAKCRSGLYFMRTLHEGLPPPTADDNTSAIEGYQCNLREGKTIANADQANSAWIASVEASKGTDADLAKFNAYVMIPWLANTPYDLIYLVVNDNLADFGKINTAALTSAGGQAAQAGFDAVMTCEAGLFTGKAIRRPVAQQ